MEELAQRGASRVPHLNAQTLLDHVVKVMRTLEGMGAAPHVSIAGLFHSVYGSELFPEVGPARFCSSQFTLSHFRHEAKGVDICVS